MPEVARSALKTGKRPVQVSERVYKPGDVLFEEGSTGKEIFVINKGKVGVFKKTPEGEFQLADVGESGVIGEMSLLDNLPRSATVRAIEETRVLPISPAVFQATLESVPVWLASIIKIVVSRLRDANKRVDQPILRDRERGMASLMLLMLPRYKYEFSGGIALDYEAVLLEAFYVCRLRKKEIVTILEGIQKREIIALEEDAGKKKHICIKDIEVLRLYEEYLVLKSQKKGFREVNISGESLALLNNIAYVAQKSGRETDDGTALAKSDLLADLEEKQTDRLERDLLDLKRRNLVNLVPSEEDTLIVFRRELLTRIKKIKEWLPKFEKTFAPPV